MTRFQDILKILHDHKIDYILIGGLAMVVHGYAGATYDLDIVFERSRENLSRLVQALSPYHPRPRDFDDALPFVFDAVTLQNNSALTLKTDLGAIDLFAEIPGFKTYEEIEKAAESID